MPSWATPLVHRGTRTTVVTNSPKAIRGHDAATGKELWQVADGTQVKVPTPVVFEDLVIVTGGWPTGGRPIFAIRAATGEVAWKLERGSPYTTTPLVYQGVLYVMVDNGVLSAYDARTGRRFYQQRLARDAGGFSASPVAAAGRVYLPSEDGVMFVVRAGRTYAAAGAERHEGDAAGDAGNRRRHAVGRTRTHVVALRGAPPRTASQHDDSGAVRRS